MHHVRYGVHGIRKSIEMLSLSTSLKYTGGAEEQLHSFLTSALDGVERPTARYSSEEEPQVLHE